MATRAILQRKRSLVNALSQPSCSSRFLSDFELGQSSSIPSSWGSSWVIAVPSVNADSTKEKESFLITKDKLQHFSDRGLLRKNVGGSPPARLTNPLPYYGSSLGASWLSNSSRYYSTAAAGQPDFNGSNDRNEEKVSAQSKEPSPEECDQAVEGLSSVKAKAKAKQMQETQKSEKSMLQRVWAKLLGIGPALKVVASMSR